MSLNDSLSISRIWKDMSLNDSLSISRIWKDMSLNDSLSISRIWKDMSLNDSLSELERSKLAVWDYPVSDKYTKVSWTEQRETFRDKMREQNTQH